MENPLAASIFLNYSLMFLQAPLAASGSAIDIRAVLSKNQTVGTRFGSMRMAPDERDLETLPQILP